MCLVLVMLAVSCAPVGAQTYPNRPVRMISPYPPGGGTDAVARIVAQALTDQLGQQVVVDSRGGANGLVAGIFALQFTSPIHVLVERMQSLLVGFDGFSRDPRNGDCPNVQAEPE